jgi:hypothetical protein
MWESSQLIRNQKTHTHEKPCEYLENGKGHKIKARAHKGGVRIGKTPKKLASICCP